MRIDFAKISSSIKAERIEVVTKVGIVTSRYVEMTVPGASPSARKLGLQIITEAIAPLGGTVIIFETKEDNTRFAIDETPQLTSDVIVLCLQNAILVLQAPSGTHDDVEELYELERWIEQRRDDAVKYKRIASDTAAELSARLIEVLKMFHSVLEQAVIERPIALARALATWRDKRKLIQARMGD